MVKFFRIKQKARGLARRQKYDLALAEYRTAIAQAELERDVGALRNLLNAAGDAALQKNDMGTAVEYFEKAADSYVKEGLHDNAIALCHKILRHVPTRVEVYAALGRIYAEKGLRSESLQNWLEYAGRREKAGDLQGVIRAFREVIALAPESDAIREQLAAVLLTQKEVGAALVELEELRRRAELAGDTARLEELSAKIAGVRRDFGIESPAEEPPAPSQKVARPAPEPSAEPAAGPGLEREREEELIVERFEAPGGLPSPVPDAGPAAARVPGLEAGFGFSGGGAALPPLEETAPPVPSGKKVGGTAAAEEAGEEVPSLASLPGFTLPSAQERASLKIAPPYVPVEERIARAEARVAESPADAEERIYLAELYQEQGAIDRARAAMEQGARELFQVGEHEKAYRAYRRLAALVPEEIEVVQKLVEVAQAAGSREQLLQSYELLGDRLMEAGQYRRAAEVHRRVLEIDPEHRHSHDQLLILEGLDAPVPSAGAKPGRRAARPSGEEDYVDLAKLIMEGEPARVAQPRMVAKSRPTGDEQADLEAVIDAFRRGVEENIEEGDSESHYDLGVAFREMGLLDEAVREFQLAARDDEHRQRAFELMGLCFMEKGMVSVAANCFRRGIEAEGNPHEALGLHYHLARSLEELGQMAAARDEYEKVLALDVRFMDAAERLKKLG